MRLRKTEKYQETQSPFVGGIKKSPEDKRDRIYAALRTGRFPAEYSIRDYCPPIKNQGPIGSCASFAFATSLEILGSIRGSSLNLELSELFHYYVVRSKDYMNSLPQDSGQFLRDGCKVLKKVGIAPEVLCPYVVSKYNEQPNRFAYSFARFWKIYGYHRCYSIDDMKSEISKNKPVVFGMRMYDSFISNNKFQINDQSGRPRGGHAMVLVAYDDEKQSFLLVNSWGIGWGKRGYAWISYNCLKQYLLDAWSLI